MKTIDFVEKEKLLYEARTAINWGEPSSESIGYSHSQLLNIIRKLVRIVEQVPTHRVTDDI
jgi:hypothetical protein